MHSILSAGDGVPVRSAGVYVCLFVCPNLLWSVCVFTITFSALPSYVLARFCFLSYASYFADISYRAFAAVGSGYWISISECHECLDINEFQMSVKVFLITNIIVMPSYCLFHLSTFAARRARKVWTSSPCVSQNRALRSLLGPSPAFAPLSCCLA